MRRTLNEGYELDDDPSRVDREAVHAFLTEDAYWARGRTLDQFDRSLDGSRRVLGLYAPGGAQAGFARIVSDGVTFAYLADVFVLPAHRGRGLGVELAREAVDGGGLGELRWILGTADAHELYRRLGFDAPSETVMERRSPGGYPATG